VKKKGIFKTCLAAALLYGSATWAQDRIKTATYGPAYSTPKPWDYILKAETCSVLNEQVSALEQWFIRRQLKTQKKEYPQCHCQGDLCELYIKDWLPLELKALLDNRTEERGFSCYQAALWGSGLWTRTLPVTQELFIQWLRSPACTLRTDPKTAQPGDIATVWLKDRDTPIHAFIYLTEDLSFQKTGQYLGMPYEFVPTSMAREVPYSFGEDRGYSTQAPWIGDLKTDSSRMSWNSKEKFFVYAQIYNCNPTAAVVSKEFPKIEKAINKAEEKMEKAWNGTHNGWSDEFESRASSILKSLPQTNSLSDVPLLHARFHNLEQIPDILKQD